MLFLNKFEATVLELGQHICLAKIINILQQLSKWRITKFEKNVSEMLGKNRIPLMFVLYSTIGRSGAVYVS